MDDMSVISHLHDDMGEKMKKDPFNKIKKRDPKSIKGLIPGLDDAAEESQQEMLDDQLETLAEIQQQIEALYCNARAIINELKPQMDVAKGKHLAYSISGSERRLSILHRTKTKEEWEVNDKKKAYRFKA